MCRKNSMWREILKKNWFQGWTKQDHSLAPYYGGHQGDKIFRHLASHRAKDVSSLARPLQCLAIVRASSLYLKHLVVMLQPNQPSWWRDLTIQAPAIGLTFGAVLNSQVR